MTAVVAAGRPVAARRFGAPLDSGMAIMLAVGALVAFLALYPLGWLAYGSLSTAPPFSLAQGSFTWANYARAYGDPFVARTVLNTLVFASGQTVAAVALGTALGFLLVRTNLPGRGAFQFLILVLFLMPLLLAVVAWTMLLSPQRGLINALLVGLLGLERAPFDIYGMGGMIFVQGLYLTPLAFLMISPAFLTIDAGLEEAARMSGARGPRIFLRITLPLARPAILSAAILLFVIGLESFDVPQMLGAGQGIYTYTSLIYYSLLGRYPPDYGVATALAVSLLAFSVLCVVLYRRATARAERFETVRGRGYRPATFDLGSWRWPASAACWLFFAVTVFLPMAILVIGSLLQFFGRFDMRIFARMSLANYQLILDHPALLRGVINSLALAAGGGLLCVLLAAVIAFIAVRSKLPGRGLVEAAAMLPISFPGTVLGLGLLWAYIAVPLPIYGTPAILLIAYVTRYLPIALRTIAAAMVQIGTELDEAARMCGASWLTRLRRIILPLLRPALLSAWVILFMVLLRELPMSALLATTGNPVVSVVMFDYYQSGELGPLAAVSVLLMLLVLAVVALARKWIARGLAHGS